MKVQLGYLHWNATPFYWDLVESTNFHGIITGYSGSGKTYTINKIVQQLSTMSEIQRVYIFDVHGDIGDDLPSSVCSTVDFSETAGNGINLLEISSDPKYGGPRKRINEIIKTIQKTGSSALGARQTASLSRYMKGLYASKGIYAKNPSTWSKKPPTLSDLRMFLENSLKAMELTSDLKTAMHLSRVNEQAKLIAKNAESARDGVTEAFEKLEEYKNEAKTAFIDFVDSIKTGDEFEQIIEMKKNVTKMVESLLDRIQLIEDAGVFNGGGLRFDGSKKIFRFDLRTLSLDEKIIFIDTMSKRIYDHAISKGITKHAREIIVIDEASDFVDDDKDSIYNKISIGSRKYGLGMLLASQSLHHFPDDILMNSAMKIILGVDDMYVKQVASKILVKEDQLKYLKPKVSALAMVKSKDSDAPNGWQKINFDKKYCKNQY